MRTRKTPCEEFNDPYLWDGSGEPDPEVQRLEKSLAVFAHRSEAPTSPIILPAAGAKSFFSALQNLWPRRSAAVAAIAAFTVASLFLVMHPVPPGPPRPGWEVTRLEGAPLVGKHSMQVTGATAKLEVGELLVNNSTSSATVTVAEIDEIQDGTSPCSRLLLTM